MMPGQIALAVVAERSRQAALWNRQHEHGYGDCSSPGLSEWVKLVVPVEEVGEVSRALIERDRTAVRRELVEVMAVCHAWLEMPC